MAFLHKVNVRGKTTWAIEWEDATKGAGRLGRRRALCSVGTHKEAFNAEGLKPEERAALANGATNPPLRAKLLKCYVALEKSKARDAARTAAHNTVPAFETPLVKIVDAYIAMVEYRVAISEGKAAVPPDDFGWRSKAIGKPMTARAKDELVRTLTRFKLWLPEGVTTGTLTGDLLSRFMLHLQSGEKHLAARTVNTMRGHLRAMFGALTRSAIVRHFRIDPRTAFNDDVEALPETQQEIVTHSANEIIAFFTEAEHRTDPERTIPIERIRRGKKETFRKEISKERAPVLEWALLLACTGMRRGEAEKLKWSDVDLEHGVIRIFASKTNVLRYLPLIGDPTGNVSPGFLDVLKAWRQARPKDVYVLPHTGKSPSYPKLAWESTSRAANSKVTPQGLRRTFESILAAVGFPASLAAFWLGHSVQVAESNYRAYRPGRLPGSTIDAALGLTDFLAREARRARGGAVLRMLPRMASGEGDGA